MLQAWGTLSARHDVSANATWSAPVASPTLNSQPPSNGMIVRTRLASGGLTAGAPPLAPAPAPPEPTIGPPTPPLGPPAPPPAPPPPVPGEPFPDEPLLEQPTRTAAQVAAMTASTNDLSRRPCSSTFP